MRREWPRHGGRMWQSLPEVDIQQRHYETTSAPKYWGSHGHSGSAYWGLERRKVTWPSYCDCDGCARCLYQNIKPCSHPFFSDRKKKNENVALYCTSQFSHEPHLPPPAAQRKSPLLEPAATPQVLVMFSAVFVEWRSLLIVFVVLYKKNFYHNALNCDENTCMHCVTL
jgi:hypothetical protein